MMLGLGLALIAIFATPAGAQEQRPVTVEPANVDAPGEAEFTVSASEFTGAAPYGVIPCFTVTTVEELATADLATECDAGAITLVTEATDGAWTATVTYDVPEGGMCILGFDLGQTEGGGACVTVGAAAEEGGEGAETTAEEEGGEDEELANTGVESGLLVIFGIAIVGAGAMAVGYTRRFA